MIDKRSLNNLYSFFINLKEKSGNIRGIPTYEIDIFENYINGTEEWLKKKNARNIKYLKLDTDRNLDEAGLEEWVEFLLYINTIVVGWVRKETVPLEGSLMGGCAFNYMPKILSTRDTKFWEESNSRFSAGELPPEEIQMAEKLRWFEGPSSPTNALYTPMYGCVLYEEDRFPEQFFFYDSGYVFPMLLSSYGEYIDAVAAAGAVYCWQYFYVDPELIVAKYKGVRPDTLFIGNASFFNPEMKRYISDNMDKIPDLYPSFENGKVRYWDEDTSIDRLDVIAEYLERCVRLLPDTFPFLDFTHHKNYYDRFIALYKATKG